MDKVKNIMYKNKDKAEMTILRESVYENTSKDLKIKTTAVFHIKYGKIEDIDLKFDSLFWFKIRNVAHILKLKDTDLWEEYNDFTNYVLGEFYSEYKVRLLVKDLGLNGISFYNKEDVERHDNIVVIKPRHGVKL